MNADPRPRSSRRAGPALLAIAISTLLAACSGGTVAPATASPASGTESQAATSAASATPAETTAATSAATPAASETPAPTAVPTDINPCDLVTQDEASALAGTALGAGVLSTDNNDRICTYSLGASVVFDVLVAVAPDAATAASQEPDFKATLEAGVAKAGIVNAQLTELPGFETDTSGATADAAIVSGGATVLGQQVTGIAFYALKGAVLVAVSEIAIGRATPTSDAMQAQGKITLDRLPWSS